MSATAFFFLVRVLPARIWLIGILAALAVAALIAVAVFYVVRRRWWRGALVFCGIFVGLTVCALVVDMLTFSLCLLIATVALTWLTGGSYFTDLGNLVRRRPLDLADWMRAIGAVTIPVAATALLGTGAMPAWPIIGLVCLEFAIGGLDNLLVRDGGIQSGAAWGARVLGESILLGAAFVLARRGPIPVAVALTYAAFAVAAVTVSLAFWRDRQAYLAPKA
jgi:hypothetical protein